MVSHVRKLCKIIGGIQTGLRSRWPDAKEYKFSYKHPFKLHLFKIFYVPSDWATKRSMIFFMEHMKPPRKYKYFSKSNWNSKFLNFFFQIIFHQSLDAQILYFSCTRLSTFANPPGHRNWCTWLLPRSIFPCGVPISVHPQCGHRSHHLGQINCGWCFQRGPGWIRRVCSRKLSSLLFRLENERWPPSHAPKFNRTKTKIHSFLSKSSWLFWWNAKDLSNLPHAMGRLSWYQDANHQIYSLCSKLLFLHLYSSQTQPKWKTSASWACSLPLDQTK